MDAYKRVLIVALALLVALSAALYAQQQRTAQLRGKVTDQGGKPIKDVLVTALNMVTGESTKAKTNDKGGYIFMRLSGGPHKFTFTKDGFQALELQRQVTTDFANSDLNVQMTVAGGGVSLQELNQQAAQQFQEGKYEDAAKLFLQIVETDPAQTWAYLNAGVCYYALNKADEAIEMFDKVLESDPGNINAIRYAAMAYLDNKRDAVNAEIYYEKLVKLTPDDPDTLMTLGQLYNYNKKTEQAIEAFNKVIELNEEHAEARMYLAVTYFSQKSYEEAIAHASRFLELDPNSKNAGQVKELLAESFFESGKQKLTDGKYAECIELLEKYLELAPESDSAAEAKEMLAGANYELGNSLINEGNIDEGIKHLERFIELLPDSPLAQQARETIEKAKGNQ